jgi:membrane-bound serine protease (ClpP class)
MILFRLHYIICCFLIASVPLLSQPVDLELGKSIIYNETGPNRVGRLLIPKDRPIDQSTYLQVKFALEEYRKQGVCFVLLHLDTPGGEVFASMNIAKALQEMDQKYHIPVVAVIDNWALSAGAMLAYACRFIAISPQGLMGAAEPVMSGPSGGMESAPEKIKSALRAEFASLATFYGRNPLIAEGMVDKDIILVKRKGEIVSLQSIDELKTTGKHPDALISAPGKLLTLGAQQVLSLGIADLELQREDSSLFKTPFFSQIPHVEVQNYTSWKVTFFAFLAHPAVASLLSMGLLIGGYMELQNPGLIIPGLVALSCLGLILLSQFAASAVDLLELLILGLGVLLLLVELVILPGFGVAGVLGIGLILVGLFTLLVHPGQGFDLEWEGFSWGLGAEGFMLRLSYLLVAVVASLLVIFLLARRLSPYLLRRNKMILDTDQEGSIAGLERSQLPVEGALGESSTPLKPGGKIEIAGRFYDALSEGDFIEQGQKVVVIKIEGSRIIVAKNVS